MDHTENRFNFEWFWAYCPILLLFENGRNWFPVVKYDNEAWGYSDSDEPGTEFECSSLSLCDVPEF